MTRTLKNIRADIERLAFSRITRSTSDSDFSAAVHALNTGIRVADILGEERHITREYLGSLFPELLRRIYSARARHDLHAEAAMAETLYAMIYGRHSDEKDRGPRRWQDTLMETAFRIRTADASMPMLSEHERLRMLIVFASVARDRRILAEAEAEAVATLKRLAACTPDELSAEELTDRVLCRIAAKGFVAVSADCDAVYAAMIERLLRITDPAALSDNELSDWHSICAAISQWPIGPAADAAIAQKSATREMAVRIAGSANLAITIFAQEAAVALTKRARRPASHGTNKYNATIQA